MSKIKCGQKKCKYNTSEYCMKNGIYVDEHANCDSYEEGKKVDNSKFEFGTFERIENNIICNAYHCKYNNNKNCIVDHLNINQEKKHDAKCIDYKENR